MLMKTDIKNILIPIDFSDTSLNALNTAIQMARRHEAVLHLLYVQDFLDYYPQLGALLTQAPMLDEVFKKDKLLLKKLVESIGSSHQVNCMMHVDTGNRVSVIAESALRLDTDMVVVGADTDISEQAYLEDSLPYKVLQKTRCHVLSVPAKKQISNFSYIVFPVMSDERPMEKLKVLHNIIERNNAKVAVLGIVRKHDLNLSSTIRKLSGFVTARVRNIAKKVTHKNVYSSSRVKVLSDASNNESEVLIVINANTQRNLKEFFFGNFTQKMIRNARAAVLMVRSEANNEARSSLKIAHL